MIFDEVRAANPGFGFALYALEPGGLVTLEVLTPEGDLFSFPADTAEEAIAGAFPAPPPALPSVFD